MQAQQRVDYKPQFLLVGLNNICCTRRPSKRAILKPALQLVRLVKSGILVIISLILRYQKLELFGSMIELVISG
jgi:hypothetical protein